MFPSLKLGIGIAALAGAAFVFMYIQHLQGRVEGLSKDNIVLERTNNELRENLKEVERRTNIVDKVTEEADKLRNENRKLRNDKEKRIDDNVQKGLDKPVGKLLLDFFDDKV